MKVIAVCCLASLALFTHTAFSLSLGAEEFEASRKMACVMAQQSLGQLSEEEYGEKTHSLLDGFDESERDNILAQAVGYYGGLTFTLQDESRQKINLKLADFVDSSACSDGFRMVTLRS